ncbi:thiamine diphosphokinase [Metabacillus sp. HB246100]|uniref:thiamine diphosphokinase n=1 Tax=Bacillus weihaiensis TaxID=1547283 RepID=UPI0023578DAF|nr:thiamine diphosphokinase [Bacillus weihaiensis]
MKKIALVAGGPRENLVHLQEYQSEHIIWVGIDKGVNYINDEGLPLSYAFGDFDSISDRDKRELIDQLNTVKVYPQEKDKTDTELALEWALQQDVEEVYLFGATGGRMDHTLGNIQLLHKSIDYKKTLQIIDKQNHITIYKPGTYTIMNDPDRKYISFLPLSMEVKGITLENFKYPLKNCHIHLSSTLCISNELIFEVGTFSFKEGILLMIRSRD